jgi:rfaE bifunctional protein kinase chain/domain
MNKKTVDKFKGNKALVIGDVMVDKYLTGKIDRISPEAPVPIVNLQAREARLGGAANVTLSIKALDAEPILFSLVGEDENGELLKSLLRKRNISDSFIHSSSFRRTTVKSRILSSNQQILRVDEEDTHALNEKEENTLLHSITACIAKENVSVIIFQDYNKGVLTPSLIQAVIALSKEKNIPTIVDPKKANFWAYEGVNCFKPNLKEVKEALNKPILIDSDSLHKIHFDLKKKLNHTASLITLSEHGIYYADDTEQHLIATQPRKIADVCGAGDAVLAVVALGLATKVSPSDLCTLANFAGGQVCEKVGVVPVEKNQLCRELSKLG